MVGEELLPHINPFNVAWEEVAISLFLIIPAAFALSKYFRVFNRGALRSLIAGLSLIF